MTYDELRQKVNEFFKRTAIYVEYSIKVDAEGMYVWAVSKHSGGEFITMYNIEPSDNPNGFSMSGVSEKGTPPRTDCPISMFNLVEGVKNAKWREACRKTARRKPARRRPQAIK
jgi:hypothetical protein